MCSSRLLISFLQICGYCDSRGKGSDCRPIWSLRNKKASVSCWLCVTCKQACSLREVELGILEWPTVVPSQYGIERRAEAAAQKHKASSRVPKESTPIVGTQESVSTRPVRTRKPAKPRGAPPVPLTMPSGPPAAPSTVHAGASHWGQIPIY